MRLSRVLENLIGNANKFTSEEGMISFVVYESPSSSNKIANFSFAVKDNGMGISEEEAAHIYEPFYRKGQSAYNHVEGTGLGVSIVKNTIEAAGGTIHCASKVGEGSCFTVDIPIVIWDGSGNVTENTVQDKVEIDKNCFSDKCILVVEDHPINALVAKKMIEALGGTVDTAENGLVGYQKYAEGELGRYDLIFMDIQMPVMDGFECAKKIRHSGHMDAAKVPIIAMTANAFKEDENRSLSAGINAHITKPLSDNRLCEIADRFLKK